MNRNELVDSRKERKMDNYNFFDENKKKYKANLHSHSTRSDGLLTREEMVQAYREQGYSILAFTDHELYTNTEAFDREDFIVLPGIERSITPDAYETFHLLGIGDPREDRLYAHDERIPVPPFKDLSDVQTVIDEMKGRGNLVGLNHPYWSCTLMSNVLNLQGYDFLEVYNQNCDCGTGVGNSEVYWENLLWDQRIINAIATDDNHNSHRYNPGITMWDSFGGWIMVEADALRRETVFDALKSGKFYSSSGPVIHNYGIRNGKIYVSCQACKTIIFKCYPRRGYSVHADETLLTEAEYELRGGEEIVRIICIDENGKKAWTNPLLLKL